MRPSPVIAPFLQRAVEGQAPAPWPPEQMRASVAQRPESPPRHRSSSAPGVPGGRPGTSLRWLLTCCEAPFCGAKTPAARSNTVVPQSTSGWGREPQRPGGLDRTVPPSVVALPRGDQNPVDACPIAAAISSPSRRCAASDHARLAPVAHAAATSPRRGSARSKARLDGRPSGSRAGRYALAPRRIDSPPCPHRRRPPEEAGLRARAPGPRPRPLPGTRVALSVPKRRVRALRSEA
jgi:hypothetical protein